MYPIFHFRKKPIYDFEKKLCGLINSKGIDLATYLQSECSNAAKLAPGARPLILQQLNVISKSNGIKMHGDVLARFESLEPSRSLGRSEHISFKSLETDQTHFGNRIVPGMQVQFTGDMSKKGIADSLAAARAVCAIMDSGSWLLK